MGLFKKRKKASYAPNWKELQAIRGYLKQMDESEKKAAEPGPQPVLPEPPDEVPPQYDEPQPEKKPVSSDRDQFNQTYSLYDDPTSKNIIKELPLFKLEPVLMVIFGLVLPMLLFMLQRVGLYPNGLSMALIITLGLLWSLFVIKFVAFMPTGKKVIVARVYKNSGIKLSVEKLNKEGTIQFDKENETPPTQITRVHKHFETSSGKPFIIAVEEVPQNISLIENYKPDKSSKELNAIIKTTWLTAWQSAIANTLNLQNRLKDPIFISVIIVALGLLVLAAMNYTMLGKVDELKIAIEGLRAVIDSLPKVTPA